MYSYISRYGFLIPTQFFQNEPNLFRIQNLFYETDHDLNSRILNCWQVTVK